MTTVQQRAPKTTTKRLALGELEALARALLAVLLAFLHTGIARQETVGAQRRAKLRVEAADGAGESHANCSGLTTNAAALGGANDIDLIGQAGELQRLDSVMLPSVIGEISIDGATVDGEFSRARAKKNARNRFLAAACAIKPSCFARDGRTGCTQ
jgi:hypothetical protein